MVQLRGQNGGPQKVGRAAAHASSHASRPVPQTRGDEGCCGFRFQGIVAHAAVKACVKEAFGRREGDRDHQSGIPHSHSHSTSNTWAPIAFPSD